MNTISSPEIVKTTSSTRFEGLDAFRGFAALGVVWLHTFLANNPKTENPDGSIMWLNLRDFSLPLIVMSSFFVLTISLLRKPEKKFSTFFATRFRRLWLPLFIWTTIYCLMWSYVIPGFLNLNSFGQLPSIDVFFVGYMHLWFLQFIFLGSLIVYPVLLWLRNKNESQRVKLSVLFFLTAAIYAVVFKLFIQPAIYHYLTTANPSYSLTTFSKQVSKYTFFIPIAIGLGLLVNVINNLYKQNVFRVCSLIAVLLTLITHLFLERNAFTAPMYGIAVFMAALQPWKRIPFRLVYLTAAYSYGIYILHYLLTEILSTLLARGTTKLDSVAVFSISIFFYVLSFGVAFLLRKLIPVDWLIPLVPVRVKLCEKNESLQ